LVEIAGEEDGKKEIGKLGGPTFTSPYSLIEKRMIGGDGVSGGGRRKERESQQLKKCTEEHAYYVQRRSGRRTERLASRDLSGKGEDHGEGE